MIRDKIEIINGSLIQHGKNNDRIYIMKINTGDTDTLIKSVNELAALNKYSKIFAKIHASQKDDFLKDGYKEEARIENYFNGVSDALFMTKYLSDKRAVLKNKPEIESVIQIAKNKKNTDLKKTLINFEIIKCSKLHSRQMSELYKSVFKTYPFAIDDPGYIEKTMDENIIYFAAVKNEKIIALSSCETDIKSQSAEMTDFATDPEYAGNGIALELLKVMETNMIKNNIITVYTIARAVSAPMNITFARNGYSYSGTLINNTNISGSIESMNVWVKNLLNRF